jgi:hypothetical protein
MAIKRGDRLILTVDGAEVPVEAASDELDGLVVVKQRGTFSQCPTASLRPDTDPDDPPSNFVQITANQPDPSEMGLRCPSCGQPGQFIPPNWVDHRLRVLKANFRCPQDHRWTQEFPLR